MKKIILSLLLLLLIISLQYCSKKEIDKTLSLSPAISPRNLTTQNIHQLGNLVIANVMSSNMVIQRDKPFVIWGTAKPNKKVFVTVSWNRKTFWALSDTTGNWQITIPPARANSTPQTITTNVRGFPPIIFDNILIGDVWVCTGQSNMGMPVDSVAPFPGFEGITNAVNEKATANFPQIRYVHLYRDSSDMLKEQLNRAATWSVCSPETAGGYSALAYFFGRSLNINLNIPIGLLVSEHGGSTCEDWTSKETIQGDPLLSALYTKRGGSRVYNAMLYPLRKISITGFIWDQGEASRNEQPDSGYTLLNSAMIGNWRALFNQGQLPFYIVQMAPFARNYFDTTPRGGDSTAADYAKFREAQTKVRDITPGTGVAITSDIDEIWRLHFKNKRIVAERLAALALKNYYKKNVQSVGPQFSSFKANKSRVIVSYVPGTARGLCTVNNAPLKQTFFVAGPDKIFRQGTAVISGPAVIITIPQGTPLPVQSVRFAFTNGIVANLQNSAGFPAEMFRTDSWDN